MKKNTLLQKKLKSFLFFFILLASLNSFAEGTKQIMPNAANKCGITIKNTAQLNSGNWGGYDPANNYEKIFIHVSNFSTERLYFGFQRRTNTNIYYRIKDPSGNIVFGPQLIPAAATVAAGNILTHAAALIGPSTLVGGAGGYNALSYNPTVNGDYTIEFNYNSGTVTSATNFILEYFDITVANTTSNTAINGRVFSYNWSLDHDTATNPAKGSFYVYTTDGVVSKFSLNDMTPFAVNIYCNSYGVVNTGTVAQNRQSRQRISASNPAFAPEYRLFFNDPDLVAYPSGVTPALISSSITGCAITGYCFNFNVSANSYYEILLDFNSNNVYDSATDIVLSKYLTAGNNCIPWDGKNNAGTLIGVGVTINTIASLVAGLTNLPIIDPDVNPNGIVIFPVRPSGLSAPKLFWDDTQTKPTAGGSNFIGVTSPAHTFTSTVGDLNAINTWWYSVLQTVTQSFVTPNCSPIANDDTGTTLTEDGANGTVSILTNDTDGDGNPVAPINGVGQFTVDLDTGTVGIQTTFTNATGVWTLNTTTGVVTFDPANNYNGTATITYNLCDPSTLCDTANITFAVTAVNDTPVANDDSGAGLTEDGANGTVNILTNDTDVDGNPTAPVNGVGQFTVDLDPGTAGIQTTFTDATGVWTLNTTTGVVTFDPANNYNGTATIPYTLCDPAGLCDPANITFAVTAVNDAPVANDDSGAGLTEDGANGTVNILTNDTDVDGNPTAPVNGVGQFTVDLDPGTAGIQTTFTDATGVWTLNTTTGVVTFDPANNYNGTATIPYTLCDPVGLCDPANITFVVKPIITVGTITQPTCGVATGSVALSDLPLPGTWTINQTGTASTSYTGTTATTTISGLAAGTYNFTVTSSGGLTSTATTNIVINVQPASPTIYNVTGGGTYCSGGPGVPVGLSNSQSGVNYQLQVGGINTGSSVSGTTGSSISFGNKTVAGTYTIVATNTSTTCTSNMTGSVVISAQAQPNAGTNGTLTICSGSTVTAPQLFAQLGGSPNAGGAWTPALAGAGTYTYTVAATAPCATNATATVVVSAQAQPNAGTNGTLTICSGSTVTAPQLFAQLGGSPNAGGAWTPVLAGAGTYTYTVTATAPCATNATATVVVSAQAQPNAGTNGTLTICSGSTVTATQLFAQLGGSPNAGGVWTPALAGAGTYTYTVTATAPCATNATATVVVSAQAQPNAGTNGTLTICSGSTVTAPQLFAQLGGSPNAGGAWTPVLAGAGTYTYTVTATAPCATNATATVVVNAQAQPNAGTNGTLTICSGSTVTATQLFAQLGGSPNAGGVWTPALAGAGTYTYTVTATAPCATNATATVVVNAQAQPNAGTNGTLTICSGSTVTATQLFAQLGGSPNAGGAWTPALAGAGTYTYTVTATAPCATNATATVVVSAQAQPNAGTNGTLTICSGSTVTATQLFAQLGGSPNAGGAWTPALAGAGTYTYTVAATAPCTTNATATIVVSAQAQPNAGTNGTLTICSGSTVTATQLFAQLGGSPNAGGAWTPALAGAGTYTYTVTATAPCTTDATATVVVSAQPQPNAGTNGTLTICSGSTVTAAQLFAQLGGSPNTGGAWTPALAGAGTYTYTVAATAPCTTDATATVVVSAQAQPNAGTNGTLTICSGSTVTATQLFAQLGGSPNAGGAWTPALAGAGTYTYTVTATAPCATDATATVVVSAQVQPNAGTNGTFTICSGSTVTAAQLFAQLGGSPNAGGAWTPVLAGAGTYTYTVTATAPCATDATATVVVSAQAQPNAGTNGTLTICSGSTVTAPQLFAQLGGSPNAGGVWTPALAGAGTYTYTVAATAPCATDATATIVVSAQAQPNAGTNGTLTICSGSTVTAAQLFAQLGGSPNAGGAWTPVLAGAGTYTYTVAATAPCTTNATATVVVSVQAQPNAGTNGTLTICSGSTVTSSQLFAQLGGSPNAGGAWTPALAGAGTYTYTVAATAPCTTNATATIVVSAQAQPNAGTNGTLTICSGSTVTATQLFAQLGGSPNAGGAWTPILAGAGTYTYTVAATSPCTTNATATVVVNAQAQPNAGTNGTLTICSGSTVTATQLFAQLGGSPNAGGAWTPALAGAGTYTYTVTATAPCATNATATVVVNAQAQPNAGTNGTLTICSGSTVTSSQLFAQLGGSPNAGGAWTPALAGAGTYTYTVTATAPCTTDATATVVVSAQPQPNAGTNGTLTICSGSTVTAAQLFAQLGGSPNTGGAWTPALAGAGTYTYTVAATAPCTTDATATVVVSAQAQPNAGTNGTLTICSGSTVTATQLFAQLGGSPNTGGAWTPALAGAGTYTYTVAATAPCTTDATATVVVSAQAQPNAGTNGTLTICSGSTVTATQLFAQLGGSPNTGGAWTPALAGAGTYTYTVAATAPCTTDATATVVVSAQAQPNAGTNGTLTICSGSTVTATQLFAQLGGSPNAGGAWTPALAGAGTYTYTVAATAPCATDATATVVVSAQAQPNAGTNGTLTICSGSTVTSSQLFAQLGGSPNAGGAWTPALAGAGTYTYTVAATSPCTTNATATVVVSAQAQPNAGTNGTLTICSGSTVTSSQLFAQLGGSPNAGGAWTPALAGAGTYTYTVAATSPCTTNATATVVVSAQAQPNAGTNGTLTICSGSTVTSSQLFAQLGGSPNAGGAWTPALAGAGTYTYTVTATAPCTTNATATVVVSVSPKPADIVTTASICSGDSYTWTANGNLYNTNQTGTRISNNGCTADQVLNLTVTPKPADIVTTASICSGDNYTWTANGNVYNTNQTGTKISNNGCTADQVLNLTVTPKPADIVTTASICSGDNYTWTANGNLYNTNQTGTRISNNGCTADQVLNLTVTPKPADIVTTASICSGDNYTWTANGNAYNTNQTGTRISNNGCTADQVLNLTVTPKPADIVTTANICSGDNYTWTANGNVYNTNQTGTKISNNGCTADQVLNLTVTPKPADIVTTASICSGDNYTWTANGNAYNTNQTGTRISNNGCTADQVLNLTVTPKPADIVTTASICSGDNYTWTANGNVYNTNQTGTKISNNGCTADQVLNLTVTPKPADIVTTASICSGDNYTWTANGNLYNTNQTGTRISNNGCTADQVLNLTVTPKPADIVTTASICSGDNYTWTANGNAYNTNQTGTRISNNGCTADQVLNLTVTPKPADIVTTANICSGDNYTWTANGNVYNTNQTGTKISNNGCTADQVLNLTVTPKPADIVTTASICSGDNYTWTANGNAYNTNQTGTRISNNGCTADQVLNLTVTPKPADIVTTASICSGDNYTWTANGNVYNTNQTGTKISNNGCTADQVLNLTVTPKPADIVTTASICSGDNYTWTANGNAYNTNQTGTRISNNGCTADQVLNLTVTPKPADIVTTASICSGDSYIWTANGNAYNTNQTGTRISNNGCTADKVLNLTVTPKPSLPDTTVIQPTCILATGTITITLQTIGETYSFDNGSTFQASNIKSGLAAGSYDVIIKSVEGCDSPVNTTIVDIKPNCPPIAANDPITVTEDTIYTSTVDLDANDTDLDLDTLTVIPGTFSTANGGTLVLAADGSYTYTPALNYSGPDSVDYTVTDGSLTDIGTLTIDVLVAKPVMLAVNDNPLSSIDGINGVKNILNVLSNDSIDSNPTTLSNVTLSVVTPDALGYMTLNPNGSIDIKEGTPAGTYSLIYQICESIDSSNCGTAVVTVNVTCNSTKISGVVLNLGTNTPLANVPVTLIPDKGTAGPILLKLTKADGSYNFTGFIPGDYIIQVQDVNLNNAYDLYNVGPSLQFLNIQNCNYVVSDFAYDKTDLPVMGNFVWYDINSNGLQDEWFDANNDGVVTKNIPDANGSIDYSKWEWIDYNGDGSYQGKENSGEINAAGLGNGTTNVPNIFITGPNGYSRQITMSIQGYWRSRGVLNEWGTYNVDFVMESNIEAAAQSLVATGLIKNLPQPLKIAPNKSGKLQSFTICGVTNGSSKIAQLTPTEPVDNTLDFGINCKKYASIVANNDVYPTLASSVVPIVVGDVTVLDTSNGVQVTNANTDVTPVTAGPLSIDAIGTLTLAPNTASGTYTITYQLCEAGTSSTNCDSATATVVVLNPIVAKNDIINILDTRSLTNISPFSDDHGNGEDTFNGTKISFNDVIVTVTDITLPSGQSYPVPKVDGSTKEIVIPANVPAGLYVISYQICEKLNPTNCSSAEIRITVATPLIEAVADITDSIEGSDKVIPVLNVLTDDKLYNAAVVLSTVNLTQTIADPTGFMTLKADGTVELAPNTPAGIYNLTYSICEKVNPTNCSTTTVKVVVTTINAVNDTSIAINGTSGGTSTVSVFANDTFNGLPLNPIDVNFTVGTLPVGTLINPNGTIIVAPNTTPGTYSVSYSICQKANPTFCATASITLVVDPCQADPVLDCDNDGLSNGEEATLGTDPLNPDTDGDGVIDGTEVLDDATSPLELCDSIEEHATLNPSTAFLDADCDEDGVKNGDEFGNTPRHPFDSNGNGTPDYLEINNYKLSNSEDDIEIFNGVSPSSDDIKNNVFTIRNIEKFPNNTVEIYNRWGVLVYETKGYGQGTSFFRGESEGRVTVSKVNQLPADTYFYILKYVNSNGDTKERTGYLYINR